MMMKDPHWYRLFAKDEGDELVVTLTTMHPQEDETLPLVRMHREDRWRRDPSGEHEKRLVGQRYWLTDKDRAFSSVKACLASLNEPVESNEP